LRQIVLIERNLFAVLADDCHSASIIKVFRQREGSTQFEEIHCTQGVGMVMRLFLQVSGSHLLFETDDGMIHDLGDAKAPATMAASATTRFSSRCSLIGFANVENHVILSNADSNFRMLYLA
jgi:hypothetical protein